MTKYQLGKYQIRYKRRDWSIWITRYFSNIWITIYREDRKVGEKKLFGLPTRTQILQAINSEVY